MPILYHTPRQARHFLYNQSIMIYHRLFISVPLSDALKAQINEWQKAWSHLPVRWLEPEQLHITVAPPWQEKRPEEVKEILAGLKPTLQTLSTSFNIVTFGPNPQEPRLIWAEGPTPTEIVALKDRLEKALGLAPLPRLFKLHLTLARFRPEEFPLLGVGYLEEKVEWRDTADSYALIESFLEPDGVKYKTLANYKL